MNNLNPLCKYEELLSEYEQCDIEYDANQMALILKACWSELNHLEESGFFCLSEREQIEQMAKSFIDKYVENDLQNCGLSPLAVDVMQFTEVLDFISDYIYDKDTELFVTDPYFAEPKISRTAPQASATPTPAPDKTAAAPEPSGSKEASASDKAGLIIMRVLFALVAIGGSFIYTYASPIIGGIIFAVGAFLFWVALKMKPEDLNNKPKDKEDASEES